MTYADLRLLVHELTTTNTTSLPSATLNLYTQPAEDRAAAIILKNDSKWQFDDLNRTTNFPIDTIALVSGQQDYNLGTTYLSIDRVELLPNNANTTTGWTRLIQTDQQELKRSKSQALTSYQATSGTPAEYDLVGNSVFLYPKPNYSQAASLKFFYTRGPLKFDYSLGTFTDGTGTTASTPGFASLFHSLVGYYASYEFAVANGQTNANGLMATIQRLEGDLIEYYGKKDRDFRGRFTVSTTSGPTAGSGVVGGRGGDSNK